MLKINEICPICGVIVAVDLPHARDRETGIIRVSERA